MPGTFYEDVILNHVIYYKKVTLFRGKGEGWVEEGLKGVNIVTPPPLCTNCLVHQSMVNLYHDMVVIT